jgi:hypothetical protein
MPTPRPETSVTCLGGAEARREDQAVDLLVGHRVGRVQAALAGLGQQLGAVQALAVVAHLDDDAAALVAGDQRDRAVLGLALGGRSAGSSMPWSQLLRTRWVNGSVIFSTRPLSSSVASPT